MTTEDGWLGGMGSSFNQAITMLSLMVGFFCASTTGRYSLRIGSISVSDEAPLTRAAALPSGTRVESFRDAVRERDRRCIITGRRAVLAHVGRWRGFEATHIFPLAYEKHWNDHNYGSWITVPPAIESHGSINSVQNGILLKREIHDFFDSYDLAINPDV